MTKQNEQLRRIFLIIQCSKASHTQGFGLFCPKCLPYSFKMLSWTLTWKSQHMWLKSNNCDKDLDNLTIKSSSCPHDNCIKHIFTPVSLHYRSSFKTRRWQLSLVVCQPCRRRHICFWQQPHLSSALPAARQPTSKTTQRKMHHNQPWEVGASESTGDPCIWTTCCLTDVDSHINMLSPS